MIVLIVNFTHVTGCSDKESCIWVGSRCASNRSGVSALMAGDPGVVMDLHFIEFEVGKSVIRRYLMPPLFESIVEFFFLKNSMNTRPVQGATQGEYPIFMCGSGLSSHQMYS